VQGKEDGGVRFLSRIERFEIWNYEQFEFKGATPCTRQREGIKRKQRNNEKAYLLTNE
jgi:hypothetical protein